MNSCFDLTERGNGLIPDEALVDRLDSGYEELEPSEMTDHKLPSPAIRAGSAALSASAALAIRLAIPRKMSQ